MLKLAIPIFNPQDKLEQAVQEAYYEICNRYLSAIEIHSFIESIIAYEGLFEQFLSYPKQVSGNIFKHKDETPFIYVPCYTIELRQILKNRKIVSPYKVAGLKQQSAKEFFTEYPVILVLNADNIDCDKLTMQGVTILEETVDISKSLVRVLTRDKGDSDCASIVDKIVEDEFTTATVHTLTDVPGLSYSKVASTVFPDFHKYIVNIESLDIENEVIKSKSPEEAVQEALDRVWRKTKNPHKEPEYNVDSWKNTEYWPMIVKKASLDDIPFSLPPVRAATWYENMKSMGEGTPEVDWLCGNVIRSNFLTGAKDEVDILVFDTGVERFKLTGDEEHLKPLINKNICAKGVKEGYFFTINEYRINDGTRPSDVVYMKRTTTEDMVPFEEGDKVRQRKRDMAFPQLYGKVVKIKDGLMHIKWEGIKEEEVFKLNNPASIHIKVEKVGS